MIDIVFVFPLYYNKLNFLNFIKDIENEKHNLNIKLLLLCSNPKINLSEKEFINFIPTNFFVRSNAGGGEGVFHFIQSNSLLNYLDYRYIWYMEESCVPIRKGWLKLLIEQLDDGIPLNGWDWNATGKFRQHAKPVKIKSKRNKMTAFLNVGNHHFDSFNRTYNYIWDTPGYRHESIVFPMSMFASFKYPDPNDHYFSSSGDERYYGVRAERFWWSPFNYYQHRIPVKSPNLQWEILLNNLYVPNENNINFKYFRELDSLEKIKGVRHS